MKKFLYLTLMIISNASLVASQKEQALGDSCTCNNEGLKGIFLPNPFANNRLECNCHNFNLLPHEFALTFAQRLHNNPEIIKRYITLYQSPSTNLTDKETLRTLWILSSELLRATTGNYGTHMQQYFDEQNKLAAILNMMPSPLLPRTIRKKASELEVHIRSEYPLGYTSANWQTLAQTLGIYSITPDVLAEFLGRLIQKSFELLQKLYKPNDTDLNIIIQLKDNCRMIGQDCSCSNTRAKGICSINAEQVDDKGNIICHRCRELSCNCH